MNARNICRLSWQLGYFNILRVSGLFTNPVKLPGIHMPDLSLLVPG